MNKSALLKSFISTVVAFIVIVAIIVCGYVCVEWFGFIHVLVSCACVLIFGFMWTTAYNSEASKRNRREIKNINR
jgi:hypothetical protein